MRAPTTGAPRAPRHQPTRPAHPPLPSPPPRRQPPPAAPPRAPQPTTAKHGLDLRGVHAYRQHRCTPMHQDGPSVSAKTRGRAVATYTTSSPWRRTRPPTRDEPARSPPPTMISPRRRGRPHAGWRSTHGRLITLGGAARPGRQPGQVGHHRLSGARERTASQTPTMFDQPAPDHGKHDREARRDVDGAELPASEPRPTTPNGRYELEQSVDSISRPRTPCSSFAPVSVHTP